MATKLKELKVKTQKISDSRMKMILAHVETRRQNIDRQLQMLSSKELSIVVEKYHNGILEKTDVRRFELESEESKLKADISIVVSNISDVKTAISEEYTEAVRALKDKFARKIDRETAALNKKMEAIKDKQRHLEHDLGVLNMVQDAIRLFNASPNHITNTSNHRTISEAESYAGPGSAEFKKLLKECRSIENIRKEAAADGDCTFSHLQTMLLVGGSGSGVEKMLTMIPNAAFIQTSDFYKLTSTMKGAVAELKQISDKKQEDV